MFDVSMIPKAFIYSAQFIPATLALSLIPSLIDFVLGTLLALGEYRNKGWCRVLRKSAGVYSRCVPVVLTLFVTYFIYYDFLAALNRSGLVTVNVRDFKVIYVAVFALSLDGLGFFANTMWGAFLSIGRGQLEAGYSVGMNTFKVFYRIIFPQIILEALPNLRVNVLTRIMLSSLAYVISVMDIFHGATTFATLNYSYMESYVGCAVIYWIICFAVLGVFVCFERLAGRKRIRVAKR